MSGDYSSGARRRGGLRATQWASISDAALLVELRLRYPGRTVIHLAGPPQAQRALVAAMQSEANWQGAGVVVTPLVMAPSAPPGPPGPIWRFRRDETGMVIWEAETPL